MSPRSKGYAGWLRTAPSYVKAVRELAERWYQFPVEQRPFPLSRFSHRPEIPPSGSAGDASIAQFARDLKEFLDRWELMQLATWDLPCPQGPLLTNPLPQGSPAIPSQGIHIILPTSYPLQGDDDLLREIRRQQQQLAKEKNLDPSMAGLAHFAAYGEILHVLHLEQIIVQRYGQGNRPKAFMTRVEEAIAAALDCGVDKIKKLRKAISSCLPDKRASVGWLCPPVR